MVYIHFLTAVYIFIYFSQDGCRIVVKKFVCSPVYCSISILSFLLQCMFVSNPLTCLLGGFASCTCWVGGLLWFLQDRGGQNHSTSLR